MKLMIVIVQDEDAHGAMKALVERGFRVTRLASTGGMLGRGNTTLVCGLEEARVEEATEVISGACKSRQVELQRGHPLYASHRMVKVGGAVGFVVDVDRFFKL